MKPDVGLSFQILSYCIQKVLAEDRDSLLAEGLSVDAIRVIETLTFRELAHLSRLDPRFLGMTLDPKGFLTALQYVRQETDMVIMQDEMLRRRAPFPMMQALFGMTSLQYANRRKLLGIAGVGIGRPVRPSEEAQLASLARLATACRATRTATLPGREPRH